MAGKKVLSLNPTVEELVDQLGPIEAALNAPYALIVKDNQRRAEALRKLITEQVAGVPAATITLQGKQYTAVLGPRENQTKIVSMAKVWKAVGSKAFLAACSFTLKALEQLISDPIERAKLLKTDRTGSRSVKTFPIQQHPAAAEQAVA